MWTEIPRIDGARPKPIEQHANEDSVSQHGGQVLQLAGRLGGGMLRRQHLTANQPISAQLPVVRHYDAATAPPSPAARGRSTKIVKSRNLSSRIDLHTHDGNATDDRVTLIFFI